MNAIPWTLFEWLLFSVPFFGFLVYVIWDGVRRSRGTKSMEDFFLAGRSVPWWAMGLSIMATQASAITMIGTTGTGWNEGMRFIQFYFALPLAMVILSFTVVPLYHRWKVYTAYEYLGLRFDGKTRLLSAFLFLILRGLSAGIVIYAPSVVLSALFSIERRWILTILMGAIAVGYTTMGGMRAVVATDVKQMLVMFVGLVVVFFTILANLPAEIGLGDALTLVRETGRLEIVDLRWDPGEKYTLWSSLIGGLFLFLAYFGTDQSQVQRLLAGRSLREKQAALLLNGIVKLPFQFFVLLIGTLLFVFYLFAGSQVTFVTAELEALVDRPEAWARQGDLISDFNVATMKAQADALELIRAKKAGEESAYQEARGRFLENLERAEEIRLESWKLRSEAGVTLEKKYDGKAEKYDGDVNYAFPFFILHYMPAILAGILLAAIFAAALSSIDSELNAMATVTIIDGYIHALGGSKEGPRVLRISRLTTIFWGALATGFACYAAELGSVIEAVNQVGSYFYGSLLGVFILAAIPFANGTGSFVGMLVGMTMVGYFGIYHDLAFLYLNTVGTATVVAVGAGVSLLWRSSRNGTGGEMRA